MALGDDKSPKSKAELEKQISENMNLRGGQVAGSVAAGTGIAAVYGAAATYLLALTDKVTSALKGATQEKVAVKGDLVATAKITDTAKAAAEINSMPKGFKGMWQVTKEYAKTNKTTVGIVAAATAALAFLYSRAFLKQSRIKNDAKIGEAYRHYKTQYAEEPFAQHPQQSAAADKQVVGEFTQKLASEKPAAEQQHTR